VGGITEKIIADVDSPITFAPDGKRFAFVRRDPFKREDVLIIASADGAREQPLVTRRYPEFFYISGGLAWSPDGRRITVGAGNFEGNHHQLDIIGVAADGRGVERISGQKWYEVAGLAWLGDGSALLLVASDERNGARQLWRLSAAPGAGAVRTTNDVSDYRGLSLAANADALVTMQVTQHSDIWTTAPYAGEGQSKQLTSGKYDGFYGLDWTPQGQIVYGSTASGKPRIWIMEADGAASAS
jgi:dipeptidyl aminopeptidase/acylaminoacyl peptidase